MTKINMDGAYMYDIRISMLLDRLNVCRIRAAHTEHQWHRAIPEKAMPKHNECSDYSRESHALLTRRATVFNLPTSTCREQYVFSTVCMG
ncbi:hypothetical protein EKH79_04135 [Dyella dinghuensis]|uniref:Uncharacterized protein n=1 Tax=Dyella dinghuensis TaxID=1920169 RepID=A0A432LX27_9GAMM|nr:hypothetical protein [Dyella dinghuensis]RUL65902.1 hypothetical protein EKH79_04135 [Dyella dinghuensis]